jgi:hypothetical protein
MRSDLRLRFAAEIDLVVLSQAVPAHDVLGRLGAVRLDAYSETCLLEPLVEVTTVEPDVVSLPKQPLTLFR